MIEFYTIKSILTIAAFKDPENTLSWPKMMQEMKSNLHFDFGVESDRKSLKEDFLKLLNHFDGCQTKLN